MEKKLIIRLTLAATISVLLYACSTKKQAIKKDRTPIAFEPLTPKGVDTFRFSYQMPPIKPLPKIFTAQDDYEAAYRELEAMLNGTEPADFERAVFVSENTHYNNRYSYRSFQNVISIHLYSVQALVASNDKSDSMNFSATVNEHGRFKLDDIRYLPHEKKELYRKALSNWAIFTYMTDTTATYPFFNLPFTYAGHDPFGMKDWSSSQVTGLLLSDKQQGNCFALTAFYKIMADRLNTGARLCTAPQHIYIQHQDPKGDYYNVELATAGHPTDGTIQTLTHTTSTAIRSGIALRSYDDKQSIGLCLVNLAKSYEHRFSTKSHPFLLRCAELVLQFDSLNLNALLLKQQVLDERMAQYARRNSVYDITALKKLPGIGQTVKALETHTALLYRLGYREMPVDMQQIIMTGVYPKTVADKNPSPFTTIDPKDPHRKEFQSSYGGLFQEVFGQREIENYGHYSFSTKNSTVTSLDTSTKNTMLIDPVAFAYDFGARMYDARLGRFTSLDPLMRKYPAFSPYSAFANNPLFFIDPDGREIIPTNLFLQTRFGEVMQKMLNHKDQITFVSKYLSQYMGAGQDLRLGVADYDAYITDNTLTVTGGKYEGKKDNKSFVNVNRLAHMIMTAEVGPNNNEIYVYETTEIYAAAVVIHEVAFHAIRESGDHFVKSDMFFDAVNSLQQYSKSVMKQDLSAEDAISIMLSSFEGMSNYDDLLKAANEKYGTNLTKEDVSKRSFDKNYKKTLTTLGEVTEENMTDQNLDTQTEEAPLE